MTHLIRQILSVWLVLAAALASTPAASQYYSDIDIYAGGSAVVSELPNVLIVLDNTGSWNSMFTREISAMRSVVEALPRNKFRVGLMMSTESGGDNKGVDGGYLRSAIRVLDDNYAPKLSAMLGQLDVSADRGNAGKVAMSFAEAYQYFAGRAPISGSQKSKTDYTGNTFGNSQSTDIYNLPGNALTGFNSSPYRSPITASCARNYIIYISNNAPNDNTTDANRALDALKTAYTDTGIPLPADLAGTSPKGVALTPSDSQGNWSDEWARFMKSSPQAITSYTIEVDPGSTSPAKGWSALLQSVAVRSGGQYYPVSSTDTTTDTGNQIASALNNIFNQILAVDSAFSAASLPVNLNARGSYLNQVYIGMFRPDYNGQPRWPGNLKQYKFGYNVATDTLSLVDAVGGQAIGTSGFISTTAQSYWTTTSTFWITSTDSSDLPDGATVEKGGAGQRQRTRYATSQTSRKVLTCIGCAANSDLTSTANAFATTNSAITAGDLGVSTTTDRADLINWVRGTNNVSSTSTVAEFFSTTATTVRPSIHNDVIHSRPAVINYGGSKGVVVFYGANDGMLRAVNGNQTGTQNGLNAGDELWAFTPQEHFSKFKRLRNNSPEVKLSTTSLTTATPRDYFVDGPIGVYQKVDTTGATTVANLYVGMRRGGRQLYAFDVLDPTTPKFLWKKTQTEVPVLGQTWSEPRVARIRGNTNPVIIMGAGYDPAEDSLTPGSTTMGNAVLVFDAFNGNLLKTFSTTRSVPSDVALVDTDYDGYVDRGYVSDVGGHMYRLDFEGSTGGTATAAWTAYQIADLGTTDGKRKFFYPPSVVQSKTFTALMTGSGDREKPLLTSSSTITTTLSTGATTTTTNTTPYGVTDGFYTVYDSVTSKGSNGHTITVATPSNLGNVADSTSNKQLGCYVSMAGAGEKVVNAPTTAAGVTYFSTNQPAASLNSCSGSLGTARAYAAPLFCGAPTSEELLGGGLPPSVVSGLVTVTYTGDDGQQHDKQVPFIIGAPNPSKSPLQVKRPEFKTNPIRSRKYWYFENAR